MPSPLAPPIDPMLARLVRRLPHDDGMTYEPKWDGFRSLVFREDDQIDLVSRNHRPLARYFPELLDALLSLKPRSFVLDGEIVVARHSRLDFSALLQRLHPAASRVERLCRETPAYYIAFDLLALEAEDLRGLTFEERRRSLEEVMQGAPPPLALTPSTKDPHVAEAWLSRFLGSGVDGLIAKPKKSTYQPGKRAMLKFKVERTADCVVAGFRWHYEKPTVGSLLLGLYEGQVLRHVGLASSFSAERARQLLQDVSSLTTAIEGHPWEHGFNVDGPIGRLPGAASRWGYGEQITWVPLQPKLVCEVAYDHLERDRFRYAARFRRWRPDREPRSCTYEQFEDAGARISDLLRRDAFA